MPLPLLAIAAGASILTNGAKTIKGAMDASAGKKLQESLIRPKYSIQDEYYNNVGIAENLAQSGLTQESKDFYSDRAEQGLTYGVDATLRGGGGVNSIASLYNTFNEDNARIAAEDSQLKISNIKSLMEQNSALAGQKTYKWAIDEYEPYKDNSKAAASAIASGNASMWNGLSGMTAALSSYAQGKTYSGAIGDTGSAPSGSPGVPAASMMNPVDFGMRSIQDTPINTEAVSGTGSDPAMFDYLQNTLRSRTYKSRLS